MRLKVGIAGAGGIAGTMARTLNQMETASAYAVASRDYQKAKTFAGAYNIEKAYGSYGEMFGDPKVDLVYIATPHSHHYEQMKEALGEGKNVLCEKAFTVNAAQALEILELGKKKKLLVAEGIWTRYLPLRNIINETMASGIIGTPRFLSAVFSNPIAHIERIARPELAGGALLDTGVYPINFALMTFGGGIKEIVSAMRFLDSGVDAEDNIIFRYADGRTALLHACVQAAGPGRCTIEGEKGHIEIDPILNAKKITVYDAAKTVTGVKEVPPQISGFEYEVESCRKAIEEGKIECPEMPHSEILKVMKIMDSIRNSGGFKYPGE
ncbi:MAG: Gfo/Idh/MocA family oxidoreductase [Treponema sp.]|jgi:predicted dehydrogenase|nr:Gfo/Idh/MocA family oxidoreductase [Treponema sp.]